MMKEFPTRERKTTTRYLVRLFETFKRQLDECLEVSEGHSQRIQQGIWATSTACSQPERSFADMSNIAIDLLQLFANVSGFFCLTLYMQHIKRQSGMCQRLRQTSTDMCLSLSAVIRIKNSSISQHCRHTHMHCIYSQMESLLMLSGGLYWPPRTVSYTHLTLPTKRIV